MRIPAFPLSLRALAAAAAGLAIAGPAAAQITFYENDGFNGRTYTTQIPVRNLARFGFNDRASSAVVRGDRWLICEDAGFAGQCRVLRPGQYPSLASMGLNDRVSSARAVGRKLRVEEPQYAPMPVVERDFRRRDQERLFEAPVTSVRAVLATAGQRCWIERENVTEERSSTRVPGAIIGAVIGGILGHQVGGGTGRDLATVGGAVAGGAIGSNVARKRDDNAATSTRDVQRCAATPGGAKPEYWDVTYNFRGQEHRVQLTAPPGATVTVNREGEPRA